MYAPIKYYMTHMHQQDFSVVEVKCLSGWRSKCFVTDTRRPLFLDVLAHQIYHIPSWCSVENIMKVSFYAPQFYDRVHIVFARSVFLSVKRYKFGQRPTTKTFLTRIYTFCICNILCDVQQTSPEHQLLFDELDIWNSTSWVNWILC